MDERGHTLTLHLPQDDVRLDADAARIEQAVTNLLTNAAKYTDPGGQVTLSLERDGGDAVIRVCDNGIGIAPEVLPRVFDLFAQAERSLDRAQGGLGIGLTLVRRIVELHGGTVEAQSPGLGGGAEFVIRLSATFSPRRESAAPVEFVRGPQHAQPARVLMLEDNADAGQTLAMFLEFLGHHVRVVGDGVAGLEAARANVPDIMLVDIGLPKMNGYEVAKAIRQDTKLQRLVLVALTGYGQTDDKSRAMAAGFDYHLTKPVDLKVLEDVVARIAPQS
jgi:CheY-like chemotaxis protein